jgi:hypothetical protein
MLSLTPHSSSVAIGPAIRLSADAVGCLAGRGLRGPSRSRVRHADRGDKVTARIEFHNEVRGPVQGGWQLCFQWCTYHYSDPAAPDQYGYRFIWRRPDGTLQAGRGQARLPDADQILDLLREAQRQGWFRASRGEFA